MTDARREQTEEFDSDRWEFISYDLWGNDEDGYEVNQSFTTGIILDIEDSDTDIAVIKALRDAGLCDIDDDERIDIDGDEHTLYINLDGWPSCELRRTECYGFSGGVQ